jgi:uncharacterized protein (DUF488 family)
MGRCPPLIYTIGHSDHTTGEFIELLQRHGIDVVVDVRSQPYSRWTPQFNREILAHQLQDTGIAYQFMGAALGGLPSDPNLYDSGEDCPDYERIEQTSGYQAGIDQLLELARTRRTAVVCSEGNHLDCHRHLLITQTLLTLGARVLHIQVNGRTVEGEQIPRQLSFL